jgi:hypothetical protein
MFRDSVSATCPATEVCLFRDSVSATCPATEVCYLAVSWFRRLVTGLSPRRAGFDSGSVHVGFLVDEVALGQISPPEYFGFLL